MSILPAIKIGNQQANRRVLATPIPVTTVWTAATIASVGPPGIGNNIDIGWRMTLVSTGIQSASIRQYAGLSGSANWLPGTLSQIDWSAGWRLQFGLQFDVGGLNAKYTLQIGGLSVAPPLHSMSAKGVSFCVLGVSADTATVQIRVHNGTTEAGSATVQLSTGVFDGTLNHWEIVYQPGVGVFLFRNGAAVLSMLTGLPSGLGLSSSNGWAHLLDHTTNTNATSVLVLHTLSVSQP